MAFQQLFFFVKVGTNENFKSSDQLVDTFSSIRRKCTRSTASPVLKAVL